MKDLLDFAGQHPLLAFLILLAVLAFLLEIIPWARRDRE